jgi:peptide methionine sulfoxide reductase msrA/msrB
MYHYNKPILIILVLLVLVSSAVGAEMNDSTPENRESIVLGMGCFWGAEKRMAALPGVVDVISGYAGGSYANPTYQKILSSEGRKDVTNHAEVVKVIFDPAKTSIEQVLIGFWENHNPTQGNRQGNDVGSNYRSAIFYSSDSQRSAAVKTRDTYQQALTAAGFGAITTEIAPLNSFNKAEEYHQDYLKKNPRGYCGIGGTQVRFPSGMSGTEAVTAVKPLDPAALSRKEQLVVFEAEECPFCKLFKQQVLSNWKSDLPIATTFSTQPPAGWTLEKELWATPTIVLFRDGKEVNRYTGYNGEDKRFWKWLGYSTLSEEEVKIAFENGTEPAFSGSLLDNRKPGTYVDPVTGEPLFRSDSKFKSGTGWPSFFQPIQGAVTLHEDNGFFSRRIEVRSASSGIHLGHVFDDGPRPTGKRYCINSKVLRFVPDE